MSTCIHCEYSNNVLFRITREYSKWLFTYRRKSILHPEICLSSPYSILQITKQGERTEYASYKLHGLRPEDIHWTLNDSVRTTYRIFNPFKILKYYILKYFRILYTKCAFGDICAFCNEQKEAIKAEDRQWRIRHQRFKYICIYISIWWKK